MNVELTLVVRLLVGGLLIAAAAAKIMRPSMFGSILEMHGLNSDSARLAAWLVIGTEGLLGGLHLFTGGTLVFTAGILLLLAFSVGVVRALMRGLAPPCGCFSADLQDRVSTRTLLRLGVLIALEAVLLVRSISDPTAWELVAPPHTVPALYLGQAILAVAVGTWLYRSPELIVVARRAFGAAPRVTGD